MYKRARQTTQILCGIKHFIMWTLIEEFASSEALPYDQKYIAVYADTLISYENALEHLGYLVGLNPLENIDRIVCKLS